ncbi:polyprenyl synthetase family protein [Lentzea chajnantorensis]
MTSTDVVTAARPAGEVLAWSRAVVEAPLTAAIATLPDQTRAVVGHHLAGQDPLVAALALLAAESVGSADAAVEVAVALQLAHLHDQVHADLMTRAARRGSRPSAWVEFGDRRAVSAADALLTLAFTHLTGPGVMALNAALLSVVDGYVREVEMPGAVEVTEHLRVAAAQHASLAACACELGALAAGATRDQAARLRAFGDHLGLARKHVDDVLALWGGPAVSGRPLHDDLAHDRRTLPVVAALAAGAELTGSPAEQARAVEQAGGRRWCEQQAGVLLDSALGHLRAAGVRQRAVDELAGLAVAVTTGRFSPVRVPAVVVPAQATADQVPS